MGRGTWVFLLLDDAVAEGLVGGEAVEVVEEMLDDGEGFLALAAGGVGSDVAVGGGPERMVGGERLGGGDIKEGGGDFVAAQGGEQSVLVGGGAAADGVVDG